MGATDTNAARSGTRDAICDAALVIIKDKGLSTVSMRSIAQRLGVSAMMPYNYYASKDELLLDLRLRLFHRFAGYIAAKLKADEPLARLREACRAYVAYSREQPEEYRLMFEAWSFEDLRSLRAKYPLDHFRSEEMWDVLRMCVEGCIPAGEAAVNSVTHLIWCQLHGLTSLHLAHKLVFGLAVDDLEAAVVKAVEAILLSAR
ncbi:MAG: TetR/AcrR family transcriptional regulator [Thermomicrobiales bacterium]